MRLPALSNNDYVLRILLRVDSVNRRKRSRSRQGPHEKAFLIGTSTYQVPSLLYFRSSASQALVIIAFQERRQSMLEGLRLDCVFRFAVGGGIANAFAVGKTSGIGRICWGGFV